MAREARPSTGRGTPLKAAFDRNQKGTPHVDENDVQIAPQNVVIEFVDYVNTGYVDISGAPVPEAQLVGSGECWVLTNGVLVKGTWTKPALGSRHDLHRRRRRTDQADAGTHVGRALP